LEDCSVAYKKSFFKLVLTYDQKIIANYQYQIDIQSKLLQKIKSILPNHLSIHVLYCVASEKKLSLYTDSAVWSSQLRFYHRTILQTVSEDNLGYFETVQFKIIPQTNEIEKKNKKNFPSIENIDFIINSAEEQDDKNLKNALNKLGNTLKNKVL